MATSAPSGASPGTLGDALAGATWTCGSTPPDLVDDPDRLDGAPIDWLAASVPGTAAEALRLAGRWTWGTDDAEVLDGRDWWFRCRFDTAADQGPWELELDGLATLADVWLNGTHVLHSENMFLAHRVPISLLENTNELVIRCAALEPILAQRHKRPRWKSRLVRSQSLRWKRTTLLGRMPGWSRWAAPVGPWRPVRLIPRGDRIEVTDRWVHAGCDEHGDGGTLSVRAELRASDSLVRQATVHIAGHSAPLSLSRADGGDRQVAQGTVHLPAVERWWPHTHGSQPLYAVSLEVDGLRLPLARVGFRTVEVDRSDGGFALSVNGLPIFCRGACWGSPDAVSFAPAPRRIRSSIGQAHDAGMNMLRLGGYATYETTDFWDACDELGMLVWQDCMLASTDPPEDPDFAAAMEQELRQAFGALAGRPALAVACGSSETYQQAAMFGLAPEKWQSRLLEHTIPTLLDDIVPGVPYVPSSPSGGDPPFAPDVGVAHYFGVGAYLRSLADARLAGVRFAAECLSFGTPPERETIQEVYGGAGPAGHDPRWKGAVARDAGTSWDFEDVRDHYVRGLFDVDPLRLRYADPERALDLGRAAVCELMSTVLTDWRRTSSPCQGALVLTWQDLWPGAGWGLVDALGRPKAPLYALGRVFAPTTVAITDEGLAGLQLHVIHDGPAPFTGRLKLRVFTDAGVEVESAEQHVALEAHGSVVVQAEVMLGGFRDLNRAYRFAPPAYDVVAAELRSDDGHVVREACYLASGPARPRLPDLGLTAHATPAEDGDWSLEVSSRLFAQYVAVDVPGFAPSDSWFHLLPGARTTVALRQVDDGRRLSGSVRALNGPSVRVEAQRAA